MKNKKIIMATIVVLSLLIITIGVILTCGYEEEDDRDELEKAVSVLSENLPTDMIVYGEKMNFPEGLKVRYIEELSAEQLDSNLEVVRHCLVINDEANQKTFTKKELKLLYSYIYEKRYVLYYVGTKNADILDKAFHETYPESEEKPLLYCYYLNGDSIWRADEIYTVENKKAEESEVEGRTDITEYILRNLVFLYREYQSNGDW